MTRNHHRPTEYPADREEVIRRACDMDDSNISVGGSLVEALDRGIITQVQFDEIVAFGHVPIELMMATIPASKKEDKAQ